MVTSENISEKLDSLHKDVENIKDSNLFKKLDSLQSEIEGIKEFLLAEKYRKDTDKIMDDTYSEYKDNLSELITKFVEELDTKELKDSENFMTINQVEDAKVISDKFEIRLKTDFINSDFIEKWQDDVSDEIRDGKSISKLYLMNNLNGDYKFYINYSPNEYETESLNLYLFDVKEDNLIFRIDENELKNLEFIRTLFRKSEYWELQVIKKSDLKIELIEYTDTTETTTDVEFETIKFK